MVLLENWINEIIVALITSVLIYSFDRLIKPFITGIIQRTPILKGIWLGYDIDQYGNEIQNSRMEIKQLGSHIFASVVRTSSNGERVFKYKGKISSGQVLLIWEEVISKGLNMGTMTLLLSGDLNTLSGKSTFNHHDIGKIVSLDKIYRKQKI